MSKIRVSELAKELGLETKAVLAQFTKLGIQVKNHLSMVSEVEISKLKSSYNIGKSNIDKDPAQKSANKIFIRRKVLETAASVPAADVQETSVEPVESAQIQDDIVQAHTITETQTKPEVKIDETITNVSLSNQTSTSSNATESQKVSEKIENAIDSASTNENISSEQNRINLDPAQSKSEPVQTTKTESTQNTAPSVNPISSRPIQNSTNTRPAFTGATIVRRDLDNVYQVKMTKPVRAPGTPYQGYAARNFSSENKFPPRFPGTRDATTSATPKSFIMPDSLSTFPPKNLPSRSNNKGYNKEHDRQRRLQEEAERNKNRAKNSKFYEEQGIDNLHFEGVDETSENTINTVRTMVSVKKRRPNMFKKRDIQTDSQLSNPTKASKKIIRIDSHISANDLASELSQKVGVIIKSLMKLGMLATANKILDFDTATLIAQDFGFETQNVNITLEDIIAQKSDKQLISAVAESRPPIITIMGHVDHGKTSLLDALRKTNVVANEAGGITQHIGAYQIEYQNRKLTFLDTPGHEAFTAMRARGAKVTDIVVLVVAADDGVMPQTIEAIAHAKAANVPLIVAINKIDKPNINIDRIVRELSEQGVISEEWGGDSMFIQVSAKTQKGLDQLVEAMLLQADVLEIKAPVTGFAEGVVIEAKRDKFRGPVATVIVTKGCLKQQDSIVVGKTMGRVRMMYSDNGTSLKEALPGTPVELIGLDNVPEAGDMFNAVASDAIAREAVAYRIEKHRQAVLATQKSSSMSNLISLYEQKDSGQKTTELPIIIKADTHGSVEAIKSSLEKLDSQKVKTKVILAAVGGITETDVVLADASRALVVGFNVRPDKIAAQRAESTGIKIMFFNIIYELSDAVKIAMAGTLEPIKQDKILGHAEVRNLFTVPKVGVIAGCLVTDGKIIRPSRLRVVRDSIVLYTSNLGSLKRFKEDAKEVLHGFECGIGIENFNDLKIGDVLESYVIEEIMAEL